MAESQAITQLKEYLTCPLSGKIFKDPVIGSDNVVYESFEYMKRPNLSNGSDPVTIVPIQSMVDEFLKLYPQFKAQQYSEEFVPSDGIIELKSILAFKPLLFQKMINGGTAFSFANISYLELSNLGKKCSTYMLVHILRNTEDIYVDITGNGFTGTVLTYFCSNHYGTEEIVKVLVDKKFDLCSTKSDGPYSLPPIYYLMSGHTPNLKYVLDNVDPSDLIKFNGDSCPLLYGCGRLEIGEVVDMIERIHPEYINMLKDQLIPTLMGRRGFDQVIDYVNDMCSIFVEPVPEPELKKNDTTSDEGVEKDPTDDNSNVSEKNTVERYIAEISKFLSLSDDAKTYPYEEPDDSDDDDYYIREYNIRKVQSLSAFFAQQQTQLEWEQEVNASKWDQEGDAYKKSHKELLQEMQQLLEAQCMTLTNQLKNLSPSDQSHEIVSEMLEVIGVQLMSTQTMLAELSKEQQKPQTEITQLEPVVALSQTTQQMEPQEKAAVYDINHLDDLGDLDDIDDMMDKSHERVVARIRERVVARIRTMKDEELFEPSHDYSNTEWPHGF